MDRAWKQLCVCKEKAKPKTLEQGDLEYFLHEHVNVLKKQEHAIDMTWTMPCAHAEEKKGASQVLGRICVEVSRYQPKDVPNVRQVTIDKP